MNEQPADSHLQDEQAQQKKKKKQEPRDPVNDAALFAEDGAKTAYGCLKFVHPPTATALSLGMMGGGWVGWTLLQDYNILALLIGVIIGIVLGGVTGVILYWALRAFTAIGEYWG